MINPTYGQPLIQPDDIVARIDALIPRDGLGRPLAWANRLVPFRTLFDARNEIERLRARVADLECVLREARHNGLIYWEPQTTRGAVQRANMMSRIDIVLNKEAQP
jgi:hypothetical protein